MNADKTLFASLAVDVVLVRTMVAEASTHTAVEASLTINPIEGVPDRTVVSGSVRDVMRVIGLLADKGLSCLLSVFTLDQSEALDAACAYVELDTPNGTRKQPPAWAVDDEGQFKAQVIADRAREVGSLFSTR
ncbi:hypothetical protein CBP36_21130 (plasmid) [Acidovorax carolinensis]|uniref:Uncharacterized protein n=1 Tax=Acidovorax carolinensis TaxID=553814 RepID=A0A240UK71_9BURK|nr:MULTISPECIES: hypothetical protein [Comamonadaceae]ART61473.1 hypothetical protein CBP36_21130 [Acidovorax carolinensis]POR07973.1 hypothetical protein BV908_18500 [Diaphorobacter sp. LR2014-1]